MLRFAALLLMLLPPLAQAQQVNPDQAPLDQYLDSTDQDAPLIIRDPYGVNEGGDIGLESQIDPETGEPRAPDAPLAVPRGTLRPIEDGAVSSQDIARSESPEEQYDAPMVDAPRARLRGLDTLTNTVNDFDIAVGETLAYKRLIVTLEACRYPEGEPATEAYAYLHIRDPRDEDARFDGWMLASSPALSALDHPRYDIWVLSCSAD